MVLFLKAIFARGHPYRGSAKVKFYTKPEKLEIVGLGEFDAFTKDDNPPPTGLHDIEIPYEPHPKGHAYIGQARYAKTWFRIGHSGDRFLHCGQGSLGCITVRDIYKWDQIYKHLIISRKGVNSIGIVEVLNR